VRTERLLVASQWPSKAQWLSWSYRLSKCQTRQRVDRPSQCLTRRVWQDMRDVRDGIDPLPGGRQSESSPHGSTDDYLIGLQDLDADVDQLADLDPGTDEVDVEPPEPEDCALVTRHVVILIRDRLGELGEAYDRLTDREDLGMSALEPTESVRDSARRRKRPEPGASRSMSMSVMCWARLRRCLAKNAGLGSSVR